MKFDKKELFNLGTTVFLVYLAVNYWKVAAKFLSAIFAASTPLILGGVVAYFVNILMAFYERHYFPKKNFMYVDIRRPVCLVLAFLTIIVIIAAVLWLVVPQLVSCIRLIVSELPDTINYITQKASALNIISDKYAQVLNSIDWHSKLDSLFETLSTGVGSIMNIAVKTVSSIFSGLITAILSIIFAVYILVSKDKLKNQLTRLTDRYLSEFQKNRVLYVLKVLDECFHSFFVGQCAEAGILGILCTIGMIIFRLPYAMMIGALVAFTALIPVAGAYIGAGVGAFMILMVSPIEALFFLIFITVLQQLEGNLIYPKVVGTSIGLPGIWVLAAVTIGGGILGVFGMLLSVPLTAAIYKIIRDDLNTDGKSPLRRQK